MKVMIKCSLVFVLFLILCGSALAEQNDSGQEGRPAGANQTPRKIRITTALPDGDQPVITERESGLPPKGPVNDRVLEQAPKAPITYTPLWKDLGKLSLSDKENALIQLEVPHDLPATLLKQVKEIEELWNSGNFDQAIEHLRSLEESEKIRDIAVGISWKVPRMISGPKWGTDVQIGSRQDIRKPCLDFHYDTGNLFAVLKRSSADNPRWTVNISTDGGQTWQETYTWTGTDIIDVSAAVVDTFLYVGYVAIDGSYGADVARIRRFFTSTGAADGVYNFKVVFDKDVDIEEVAVTSNADFLDNRIYYLAILADNSLIYYWGDQEGTTWVEVATGISNADRWLDACCNEGYAAYFLWVSFVDTDDSVHVARRSTVWDDIVLGVARTAPYGYTSVAAYQDRIIVVFEYLDYDIRYRISYNGGDSWWWEWIAYSADEPPYFWKPDVTARKGGGFAVVYEAEVGYPDTCYYRRRDYDEANWTASEPFNEVDVKTGPPMGVEWVPPSPGYCHGYGSIWIAGEAAYLGAYFDRQDHWLAGDVNGDGVINSVDIVYLINYLFISGPAPVPLAAGDANSNGEVNAADVVYLINYLFISGPPPGCK